jgi:hypothetical protein
MFVLVEHDDAEVYDRPFEPRIEGENASEEDTNNDDDVAEDDDTVYVPPIKPPAIEILDPVSGQQSEAEVGIAVGSTVVLNGLSAEKYNGLNGVVITRQNADGRHGVRIELEGMLQLTSIVFLFMYTSNTHICYNLHLSFTTFQ